jgi:hypothetical protein
LTGKMTATGVSSFLLVDMVLRVRTSLSTIFAYAISLT